MTRALFLTIPLLAACVHTPDPCDTLPPPIYRATSECVWRGGGLYMKSSPRPTEREAVAERLVDVSPPASKPEGNGAHSGDKTSDKNEDRPRKDHSRDDNGGSSDGNSDDWNGGDSHDD